MDWLLRFADPALEADFALLNASSGARIRIAAMVFAWLLILAMGALDSIFLPEEVLGREMVIRYGVLAPIPIIGVVATLKLRDLGSWYPWLVSVATLAIGLVFSLKLWVGGPTATQYYFPGVVMAFLFGHFLIGVTFLYGLAITVISVLAFVFTCIAVEPGQATVTYVAVMLSALAGITIYAAYRYEFATRSAFSASRSLEKQRDQYNSLLSQIFPDSIKGRLSQGEQEIADSNAEVTVLFADLSGFSRITRQLTPAHLVEILGRIFNALDRLAEEHGVETIKTIGDSYMAAAGLGHMPDSSTEGIVDMALACVPLIEVIALEEGLDLGVRVGLATGHAVSGVLGTRRPHFDLWGDTVNVASRMESAGIPGRVQVSEQVYRRFRSSFSFEARGSIEVKGMGEMKAYLLLGRRTDRVAP